MCRMRNPLYLICLAAVISLGALRANPQDDEAFLEDLEHRSFAFFWDLGNPQTGIIAARAHADGTKATGVSSIAVIGFGLTAYCVGAERGWISRADAEARTEATLEFLMSRVPHEHGFLPHFIDLNSGQRAGKSPYGSIDTALLLHGVLTVRQYFAAPRITELATQFYERIDWPWMTDGQPTLCMGWTPEAGFLKYHWNGFSEHLGMTLLAIASPTHPLPANAWHAWQRKSVATFEGKTFLHYPPLFVHQYPQAWWDFRDWVDGGVNYFANSRTATLAQREFCVSLHGQFPGYDDNVWGLTASDSSNGYMDWGGPPLDGGKPDRRIDGTVVPCAPGGSIPFAPRECIDALRTMRERFGDRIYGRFGFVDAFHPSNGWTNRDVLGIDIGITLLMAENYRSGLIWKWFAKNPEVGRAFELAGFQRKH